MDYGISQRLRATCTEQSWEKDSKGSEHAAQRMTGRAAGNLLSIALIF